MKKFIKDVVEIFCYINTGAMLAAASFITVFNRDESFSYLIFWEIALVSLISAVLSALIYTKENDSKKKAKIKNIIHYLLINMLIVTSAYIFDWISNNYITETLFLVFLVSFVYILVAFMLYKKDSKTADELNKKLLEYKSEGDED
ncbi:DUF3021 family protein [uncultured Clostridium sp.]|uniref:DUF3021 family protein n=1 Tax=uncultured Clostridium sp. TaxID=59620 RepID=UPI0025F2178B|nr:DUF3021 family protein [uncultured Clostridium sp.]